MWVKFIGEYVFTPPENKRVRVVYKKGTKMLVRRVCAIGAIAAGKAYLIPRPERQA